MIESSNPALKRIPKSSADQASINGIMNKTFILFGIMALGAWLTQDYVGYLSQGTLIGILVVNFIVAMVYIFNPTLSFLAPVYAITEGVLLYSISSVYEQQYPGIVTNALVATISVFGTMLFLYRSGMIKVTQGFMKFMMIAMGGILVLYLGSFVAQMFGADISYLTVRISIGVVVRASLTLLLDFHRIEEAIREQAPKNYEWYLSFGLILSLVWIYLEILRLLAKIKGRD